MANHVPSGIGTLDSIIKGFGDGTLTVIGGRPAVGKTSMAITVALNAARSGTGVLYVSMEMGKAELLERMACSVAGVNKRGLSVALAHLTDPEFAYEDDDAVIADRDAWASGSMALRAGVETVSASPLMVCDAPDMDLPAIKLAMAEAAYGLILESDTTLGLVIIDYVDLIRGRGIPGASRDDEVKEISRGLKLLAKTIGIPIVAFAQVSRASMGGADAVPAIGDLRGSGSTVHDADNVLALHRPGLEADAPEGETRDEAVSRGSAGGIVVLKYRSGKVGGTAAVTFDDRLSAVRAAK